MRNRPIRKHFTFVSSDDNRKLKQFEQSDEDPSEYHDKAQRETVTKTLSFQKGNFKAGVYNADVYQNSPNHRHFRIFKSFRKKDKPKLNQNYENGEDGSFQTLGLKSNRFGGRIGFGTKTYGKVIKTKHMPKFHKEKLETCAAKDRKQSTLQRVFSLRVKSRTDSHTEKVDISSLVKMVNFNKTGKQLANRQSAMTTDEVGKILSRGSLLSDLDKNNVLKQTALKSSVLSPTCGDLYGSDEDGLTALSFGDKHLSEQRFNETHVLDRKISLDTVGIDRSKHLEDTFSIHENSDLDKYAPKGQESCEIYSNLTFHLNDSAKPDKSSLAVETDKPKTPVLACEEIQTNNSVPSAINKLPSFKKSLDSNNCDITVENFGNPWVLKSDCAADTGSPISYKSLGFSVNNEGKEISFLSPNSPRKAHGRTLKRSTSVDSIDSFSSSIHSVKSEECLFSSDSERDQADAVSMSSSDSFTSAKDYTENYQTDLGSDLAEKLKRASSLDHLDKTPSPISDNVKHTKIFDALDNTPITKPDVKHTLSVDDVHRIIQRPTSLSFSKGYSLDSASKTDKTPKSEKKKVSKRRSLDSTFKTPEIKADFKAELDKQTLKPASSDSGLSSSILSPVQENGDVKLRSKSNIDSYNDKMYFTLPNPKKHKSYPPLLPPKRKPTRIGSLSKMLSEKAESFSGLKLGTSFKLRNLEKPITSGLNKTKSLTNLMSKKGIRVVSSISSMILGKSTSDNSIDAVDSPFKPKVKKPRKTKEDENELVYEKVKVLVPRKRPANKQELAAERKRLTLDLKLANLKQNEQNHSKELGENMKVVKRVKKEKNELSSDSSSSVGSVKSPTMLDEIMKSVDTRRFSMGLALDIGNVSDNELDDTNSRSSSSELASKKMSIVSDLTTPVSVFLSGEDYFSLCPRCKKMKHCSEAGNNFDDITLEKRTHSLIDVNSSCACLTLRNSCDSLSFDERNKLMLDSKEYPNHNAVNYSTPCGRKQTSRSLQELRNVTDLPFQNYIDTDNVGIVDGTGESLHITTENRQPNQKARRSLQYTLTKCQPYLDLSADDLDEIGSIEEESDQNEFVKTAEKSHSCSDLLDTSIETDPVIYCERPVERVPSKRGERPPVKVKSLSSSHDALTCLNLVDIPDINTPLDNVTKNEGNNVTKLDNEIGLTDNDDKARLDESSDSGNEDYHSVGSDAENLDDDKLRRKDSDVSEHTPVHLENSLDSGLTMPDSQVLLNSFQDINMANQNNKGNVVTPINDTDFKERYRNSDSLSLKERKCSGCLLSNTESIIPNTQNQITADSRRQCFSVGDVRLICCGSGADSLVETDKAASVTDLNEADEKCPHCGLIKECVSKFQSNPQQMKTNTHTKTTNSDKSKPQGTDNAVDPKASKFLFDDQHIKTYKNIHGITRGKSVSSEDVNVQSKIDSEMILKSSSALSLNKPSYKPSYIHDKPHIDPDFFPPNLSPLNGMFKLPPFHGFSAFSPPADGSQLPELEEVYKYDVCLGYLVHSIKCDNKTICVYSLQRNKQLMEGVITPISGLPGAPHTRPSESSHGQRRKSQKKSKEEDMPNPAAPITIVPSEKLSHAGHVLRTVLLSRASHMIRDRKFHLRTYRRCMVGTEMVDWLLQQSSLVHSRTQAVGMWQALVEEGVIVHVCHEHQFKDKYLFYRFLEDDQGISSVPSTASKKECEEELQEIFLMLAQIGPDAMMRMILRKLPHERTVEDLEIIYEELLHIKALSHLSTMVKRELASVLVFESHAKSGTVLFNQGDEGKSWYIILKGSVNVVIYGKGVVCTLHEGDDFGKLALVNDAPRAATIVLRDDNCHFLRVDKDDFNRILRDVEANTVRLKEHGQDVLVLEKIPTNTQSADGTVQAHYKYSIMAGTPEKMLEHLLETMLGNKGEEELSMFRDGFLEDFLLTHVIFMPCNHLCPVLLSHYHSSMSDSTEQENFEYMLTHKKCVLHFVQEWARIVGGAFKEDHTINAFLEELHSCVLEDQQSYFSLREDIDTLENILEAQTRLSDNQLLTNSGTHPTLTRKPSKDNLMASSKKRKVIKATDENIFKVYCADHTYCTLRLPMDSTVEQILSSARDKLCLGEDLILCEVKSTGERIAFKENDLCVTSGLSINGRLFITPREHLDALTPLPEQEGPPQGSVNTIELVSSREMAYYMTVHDWDLFSCVQEYELIYQVFGRYKFRKITANLDLFLRRFNEIQYWVVTEMVLATNLSKRVALLRKFIKLASYCKEYQNLNSFFAIVMGLSNIAVSRLSQTWEKLPGKFKKMFADFETLMDPSRNHRVYRLSVAKMVPPIIPFMPLLMKDMTFTHEGNKTYFDGLVNFEKMHMIAQTLKTVRFCRSANLDLETPSSVKTADISNFIKHLIVIDNQRHLTQLSHKLEPRKT